MNTYPLTVKTRRVDDNRDVTRDIYACQQAAIHHGVDGEMSVTVKGAAGHDHDLNFQLSSTKEQYYQPGFYNEVIIENANGKTTERLLSPAYHLVNEPR